MAIHEPGSLLSHLTELRSRLLRSAVVVLAIFVCLVPVRGQLFSWLALPMLKHMTHGEQLIATHVTTPFLVPFKLAFLAAVFLAVPYLLHQAWAFVSPGLYKQERRFALPLLVSSVLLFYTGIAFAYFVVFPIVFGFFTAVAPAGVAVMTDIGNYLDFVLTLFFAFGAAFEVPVVSVLLVRTGFTTPAALKRKRALVLISTFVIGMFLTPPDVFSQTLLAVPMYLLFELGILLSIWLVPGAREVEAQRRGEL